MSWILNWLKDERKLLFLIIFVTFTLRLPTLFVEVFNGDETHYATAAMVILDGGIPYVDFVDKKPPLLYYIYAFTFKIFGVVDIRFVHLMALLAVFGTLFFLYKSLVLFSFRKAGLLAALFYGLFSTAFIEQDMWAANAEVFMNFFMIISVYFFLKGSVKGVLIPFFLSGLFLTTGLLIKQQGGILYPLFLFSLIYFAWGKQLNRFLKEIFKRGSLLFIGSLIPIGLTIAYFHYVGHLDEFWTWNIDYNSKYLGESPHFIDSLIKGSIRTAAFILSSLVLWILAFHFINKRKQISLFPKNAVFLFAMWVLLTFPAVFIGGRFFGHYYSLFYPSISALGGLGAWYFLSQLDKYSQRIRRLFVIGLICSPIFFELFGITRFYVGSYQSAKPFIKRVAQRVEEESKPGDKIFSWGLFPYPYYYANRLPASKFIACEYLVPLWKNRFYHHDQYHPSQRESYHIENMNILIKELQNNKPSIIIDVQGTKHLENWNLYKIESFPKLHNFIKNNYNRLDDSELEGVVIYKRKLRP